MTTPITSNDGRLHLASPAHVPYPAKESPLTDALAQEMGGAYDVVSANPSTLQRKEAVIVGAAPTLLVIYAKAAAVNGQSVMPEAGYAHKKGGGRKYDARWKVYTAQAGSDAWRRYHLNSLIGTPPWVESHFADSCVMSYTQGGGKSAKPPGYTAEYTLAEWLGLISDDLDYYEAQTGKPQIINGLSRDTMKLMKPRIGMVENTFRSQSGKLPTTATWLQTMNLLADAQAAGWTPWAYVKLFAMDTALWDSWRRLAVPSMYLVDAGSLLYSQSSAEAMPPDWTTREYAEPCYRPRIGKPVGPAWPIKQGRDGTYQRTFGAGLVIVNPGTAATSTVLPDGSRCNLPAQAGTIQRRVKGKYVKVL